MALVSNPMLQGANGRVGLFVYRQLQGKTFVSAKAKPDKSTPSAAKQATRTNFKDATAYSKECMKDPALKAYYWERARKLNLPNAYTAAVTDYMRKGRIDSIDQSNYTGNANERIVVLVSKKGFSVKQVAVSLTTNTGTPIEQGLAVEKTPGIWIYKTTTRAPDPENVVATVSAIDTNGKAVRGGN
jgi:hypothetical protein